MFILVLLIKVHKKQVDDRSSMRSGIERDSERQAKQRTINSYRLNQQESTYLFATSLKDFLLELFLSFLNFKFFLSIYRRI